MVVNHMVKSSHILELHVWFANPLETEFGLILLLHCVHSAGGLLTVHKMMRLRQQTTAPLIYT